MTIGIVAGYRIIDIPLLGDRQMIAGELGILYMRVGWYLFLLCSVVYFVVSLATPAPAQAQLDNLCWTRPLDSLRGKSQGLLTDTRTMALILLIVMSLLYMCLR